MQFKSSRQPIKDLSPSPVDVVKPGLLTKRQRIIIVSVLLTFGLLFTFSSSLLFYRVQFVVGLGIVAYLLSFWALWEGMTKLKALVLLILPVLFSIAMATFTFLLPPRWIIKLFVAILYGLSFYSILLSQNVFSAAAIRTIPLYRAASTVTFLFVLITAFLLYSVVSSLNLPFYFNGIIVFVISAALALPIIWSVTLEKLSTNVWIYTVLLSLVIGELALTLSFWPIATTMWSLFLSTALYLLLGIMTEFMRERASARIVFEYLGIGLGVMLFTIFATTWTG